MMQNIIYLARWLEQNANKEKYLFRFNDFRALFPELSAGAYKALMSRSVKSGYLERVCRGIYLYRKNMQNDGLILYYIAALLRVNHFNYISLETVLSDAGVISQIPINRVFIMSSGKSNIISCKEFGTIEFVKTLQKPNNLLQNVFYDFTCKMWRATLQQAVRDMRVTKRDTSLIDQEVLNELI